MTVGKFYGTLSNHTGNPDQTLNQLGRAPRVGDMYYDDAQRAVCVYMENPDGTESWACTSSFALTTTSTSTSTSTTTTTSTTTSTSTT